MLQNQMSRSRTGKSQALHHYGKTGHGIDKQLLQDRTGAGPTADGFKDTMVGLVGSDVPSPMIGSAPMPKPLPKPLAGHNADVASLERFDVVPQDNFQIQNVDTQTDEIVDQPGIVQTDLLTLSASLEQPRIAANESSPASISRVIINEPAVGLAVNVSTDRVNPMNRNASPTIGDQVQIQQSLHSSVRSNDLPQDFALQSRAGVALSAAVQPLASTSGRQTLQPAGRHPVEGLRPETAPQFQTQSQTIRLSVPPQRTPVVAEAARGPDRLISAEAAPAGPLPTGESKLQQQTVANLSATIVHQEARGVSVQAWNTDPFANTTARTMTGAQGADSLMQPGLIDNARGNEARANINVMRVRLEPASLGTVMVGVRKTAEGIEVKVQPLLEQTAKLLRADEAALSKVLRSVGAVSDSVVVQIVDVARQAGADTQLHSAGNPLDNSSASQSNSDLSKQGSGHRTERGDAHKGSGGPAKEANDEREARGEVDGGDWRELYI